MRKSKTDRVPTRLADECESVASSPRGRRRRSAMRLQKTAVAVLALLLVVLIIGYEVAEFYVNRIIYTDVDGTKYYVKTKKNADKKLEYVLCDDDGFTLEITPDGYYSTAIGTLVSVDAETGSYKTIALVDTEENEEYDEKNSRFMIFKYIESDDIKSIEVANSNGTYTVKRASGDVMTIVGLETKKKSDMFLAYLYVQCGYTLARRKISDPIKDANGNYTEYGLADEVRKDQNGEEYEYSPIKYTITDMSDNSFTVYIGDETADGTAYYVRLEGRDAVYTMAYTLAAETLESLQTAYSSVLETADEIKNLLSEPVERFIDPSLTATMSSSDYINVSGFVTYDWTGLDSSEWSGKNASTLIKESVGRVVGFTYQDLEERLGTKSESTSYKTDYPSSFTVNPNRASGALEYIYRMKYKRVADASPTSEDKKAYGLDRPAYAISFTFNKQAHKIYVSPLSADGTYYVYSDYSDIIVEVARANMLFVEWDLNDWMDDNYYSVPIAWVKKITVEQAGEKITFVLDNSASDSYTNPTYSESVGEEKTVSAEKMVMTAYDSHGKRMDGITSYVLTDVNGNTWTVNESKIRVSYASDSSSQYTGFSKVNNALGDEVTVYSGTVYGKNGESLTVDANSITVTDEKGETNVYLRYGVDNFKNFYIGLLYGTVEGNAKKDSPAISDEKLEQIASDPESDVFAKITVTSTDDTDASRRREVETVYRFYSYSERRALITIDGKNTNSYVLKSYVSKLVGDAQKAVAGEKIESRIGY